MPYPFPSDLGLCLSGLRTETNFKQADLAKHLPGRNQTYVSRIENGEIVPSMDEVQCYLSAIGTSNAENYRIFLQQPWEILERPAYKHPQRDVLSQAEQSLQTLKNLVTPDISDSLKCEAQNYYDSLLRDATYLSSLKHSIVYIGNIGIGKTTAICAQTSLRLDDGEPVLAVGGGRTTLCEVRIRYGAKFGLLVTPYETEEIYKLLGDLCTGIWQAINADGDDDQHRGTSTIPEEIGRALRNMSGLTVKKQENPNGGSERIDRLKELAANFSTQEDFQLAVLSRLNLDQRTDCHAEFEGRSDSDGLRWLKNLFQDINYGKNPNFPLPKRIDVFSPISQSKSEYELEFIDTKGIDDLAIRADLLNLIEHPRTLVMFCSRFENAPDSSIQALLQNLKQSGDLRHLIERSRLLVLARADEALAMKNDEGDSIDTQEAGYELKQEQIRSVLDSLKVTLPIHFVDAYTDHPDGQSRVITQLIESSREASICRIKMLCSAVITLKDAYTKDLEEPEQEISLLLKRFIQDYSALPFKVSQMDANPDLSDASLTNKFVVRDDAGSYNPKRKLLDKSSGESPVQVHNNLLQQLENAPPGTIAASMRRKGKWERLDVYFLIGRGARVLAYKQTATASAELSKQITSKLDQRSESSLMCTRLRMILNDYHIWHDEFLKEAQRIGEQIFYDALDNGLIKENEEMISIWQGCQHLWGMGAGYRQEVVKRFRQWFDAPEQKQLHDRLVQHLKNLWRDRVIDHLQQWIIDGASDHSGIGEDREMPSDVWKCLEALTGTIDAPEDWAIQHDHYLYGTVKRQAETAL